MHPPSFTSIYLPRLGCLNAEDLGISSAPQFQKPIFLSLLVIKHSQQRYFHSLFSILLSLFFCPFAFSIRRGYRRQSRGKRSDCLPCKLRRHIILAALSWCLIRGLRLNILLLYHIYCVMMRIKIMLTTNLYKSQNVILNSCHQRGRFLHIRISRHFLSPFI
jgi:hypothetical protein